MRFSDEAWFPPSSRRHAFGSIPRQTRSARLVADLARCYQKNLSRITELIHAKPSASIKEFARAFDLKKDR